MPEPFVKTIRFISATFFRFEELFLSLLLTSMILLACMQIILRLFFSGGLLWADPLLRYLVLVAGLLGAAAATSRGKHIALDIISFLVPQQFLPWLRTLINLCSATVCGFLTWAAIIFVRNEAEFGSRALLSIPSWIWNMIFPVAFTLITLRFLIAVIIEAPFSPWAPQPQPPVPTDKPII
ncbi:TRAP transporter small permease [Thermodesulfobacteriota bacterium]